MGSKSLRRSEESICPGGIATAVTVALFAFSIVLVQPVVGQTTYALTVKTDSTSYVPSQSIVVSGAVSPAPGSSNSPSGVTLRIKNPSGALVTIADAAVDSSTGNFQYTFVAGGTSAWVAGTYTVNATWGASPPTVSKTTTFTYSTSTTTSSSSTTTTSTSSTPKTSTSSSATSTTSLPSCCTTTTRSSTSSSSSSTSSSSSGGGIPEFPVQPVLLVAFALVIAALYIYSRQGAKKQIRMPV